MGKKIVNPLPIRGVTVPLISIYRVCKVIKKCIIMVKTVELDRQSLKN